MEQTVNDRQKALDKAKKAAESVVTAIANIEEQISNAGGLKLKKQREKGLELFMHCWHYSVQQISTEIDSSNETATKLEVAITSGNVAIDKLQKSISRDKKKLEGLEEELAAKKKEGEELVEVAEQGSTCNGSAIDDFSFERQRGARTTL